MDATVSKKWTTNTKESSKKRWSVTRARLNWIQCKGFVRCDWLCQVLLHLVPVCLFIRESNCLHLYVRCCVHSIQSFCTRTQAENELWVTCRIPPTSCSPQHTPPTTTHTLLPPQCCRALQGGRQRSIPGQGFPEGERLVHTGHLPQP